MKITALEIRQKAFDKEFRGYKKDEVDAFLLSLSQAWEKMVGDHKELVLRLEHAEKEVQKLREVEDSLFKTLKTAETTGASMVEQANKSAELLMKETKLKAEQLYNDAQNKSDLVISRMQNEIRELEQEYRAIENQRDTLIREIKAVASDTLERVAKTSTDKKDLSAIRSKAENISSELRNNTSKTYEPLKSFDTPSIEVPQVNVPEKVEEKKVEKVEEIVPVSEKTEEKDSIAEVTEVTKPVEEPEVVEPVKAEEISEDIPEKGATEEEIAEIHKESESNTVVEPEASETIKKEVKEDKPEPKPVAKSDPTMRSFFDDIAE